MMRVPVPGASKLAGMGSNPDGDDDILQQHNANKQWEAPQVGQRANRKVIGNNNNEDSILKTRRALTMKFVCVGRAAGLITWSTATFVIDHTPWLKRGSAKYQNKTYFARHVTNVE